MSWWMALPALFQGMQGLQAAQGAQAAGTTAAGAQGGMGLAESVRGFGTPGVTQAQQQQPQIQQGGPLDPASNVNAQNRWKAKTDGVNNIFNSLRAFGTSLGGIDKTPLNNIPRNPAQVIYPQNNQNPGSVALMALMQKIAGA